jgi:hypothetical protein
MALRVLDPPAQQGGHDKVPLYQFGRIAAPVLGVAEAKRGS